MLVTRHPTHTHPLADHQHQGSHSDHDPAADHGPGSDHGPSGPTLGPSGPALDGRSADSDPNTPVRLQERLRKAMALLPPVLGGAPSQPLDVGRATRVVQPAQRSALAVRDGGCVFPGCDRPLPWCEAHHLRYWLDGGPTDLANLALLCRAHHRDVHEGGWRLIRGPDGRFTATPPHRRHRAA